MSGWRSLFSKVLDNGNAPLGLFKYLTKKWAVPEAPQDLTAKRSLRSNTDAATGSIIDMGFPVLEDLGDLVSRGVEGLDNIALLSVNKNNLVSVLHSLFLVGESA